MVVVLILALYVLEHGFHLPYAYSKSARRRNIDRWERYSTELWALALAYMFVIAVSHSLWGTVLYGSFLLPLWARWVGISAMVACTLLLCASRRGKTSLQHYAALFASSIASCVVSANLAVVATAVLVAIVFSIRLWRGLAR